MDPETKALIEQTADHAADRAVLRAFTTLGFDPGDPLSAQRDMAALRGLRTLFEDPEFQADMVRWRSWRKSLDKAQSKGIITIVGIVITGLIALMVLGVQQILVK